MTSGSGDRVLARRVAGVDAGVDDGHPGGVEAQVVDELALGGLAQRGHGRAPVQRRGDPALEQRPEGPELGPERHVPHLGVDVVQQDDPRPGVPHRAEERHAVPDLDEHVPGSGAPGDLGERGPGEHLVAAGPADDPVAVPHGLDRLALGPRRAHGDLDPGRGPQLGDLGDVDLGPPGLDVVEVAPGEHVDAPDPGRRGQVADLGDRIGVVGHSVAHRWSSSPRASDPGARQ